jgi:CBS domain-containing protein/GNAT superfamily N-acetyltransferase
VKPDLTTCTICRAPHAFVDKAGEAILVTLLGERRHDELCAMYLAYCPRNSFNGLPPISDEACEEWARGMVRQGVNLVALSFWDGVVGHAALFPMDERSHEMLVVVNPAHQNRGIGTELTRSATRLAVEIGCERVWLSVEAMNLRARHVYAKCGFEQVSAVPGHVEMEMDLRRYARELSVSVAEVMTSEVVTSSMGQRCSAAVDLLTTSHIGALPVVNERGELAGIVSETDLMQPVNLRRTVGEVMTRKVITIRDDCSIEDVIKLFLTRKVRCIPVVDAAGALAGVVGRKDILSYYSRRLG